MKNSEYLNWLFVMGLHDTISHIDEEQSNFYKSVNKQVDVISIILHEYKNNK